MKKIVLILCSMLLWSVSCKTVEVSYVPSEEVIQEVQLYDSIVFAKCIEDLKVIEGFRTAPYWDINAYAIGYGHKVLPNEELVEVTRAEAEQILIRDFKLRIDAVHKRYGYTGNKLLALARFTFNLGMKRTIMLMSKPNVEGRWLLYCKYRCQETKELKVSQWILSSRQVELELWLS